MSWRLVFLPDEVAASALDWADAVIGPASDREALLMVARFWAWQLPMKLYVVEGDRDNARLQCLEQLWQDDQEMLWFDEYEVIELARGVVCPS